MKSAAIALLVAIGLYMYGHHNGWNDRDVEMQAEIAAKNEEARKKEQELQHKLTAQSTQLQEANHAIAQKQTDLDKLIRAGRVRLPTASCVQAGASAGSTGGNWDQAASESDRETLRAIAEIAAAGDKAINQLNACIDAYNQVKETLNGQR